MADDCRRLRAAGVRRIFLVHGTFVGEDILGVLRVVQRLWPATADYLTGLQKAIIDSVAQDAGNYSPSLLTWFQQAAQAAAPDLMVESLDWSGENDHVGRVDGAIQVLDRLARLPAEPGDRALFFAHSHGGNVMALVSNLLAASPADRRRLFDAASAHYRSPITGRVDLPYWKRVQEALQEADHAADHPLRRWNIDVVTFGTPIRYGWDTGIVNRLLHVVFHRPKPGLPEYRGGFPPAITDLLHASGGDYIQQLGVAGTNFPPGLTAWRKWTAEIQLDALLQDGVRNRDVLQHMQVGARTPEDGLSLLIDYGDPPGNITQHLAGHAVYTRQLWLPFHVRLAADSLYAGQAASDNSPAAPSS